MPDRFTPAPKQLELITSTAPVCIWQPAAGERGTGGTTALIASLVRDCTKGPAAVRLLIVPTEDAYMSAIGTYERIALSVGVDDGIMRGLRIGTPERWARGPSDGDLASIYLDNPTPALIASMREAGVWAPRVRVVTSDLHVATLAQMNDAGVLRHGPGDVHFITATRADNPHVPPPRANGRGFGKSTLTAERVAVDYGLTAIPHDQTPDLQADADQNNVTREDIGQGWQDIMAMLPLAVAPSPLEFIVPDTPATEFQYSWEMTAAGFEGAALHAMADAVEGAMGELLAPAPAKPPEDAGGSESQDGSAPDE